MIIHKDYDSISDDLKLEYTIPTEIKNISISHDGGRISIKINNEEVFYTMLGTRDCNIEINRE